MLLHKWCPFLMRMMSPLTVGLILFYLIGVSSLSHQSRSHQNHSIHSTAVLKSKRNAIYSPYAKDSTDFIKTKNVTETPKVSSRVSSSSRPIIGLSSGKITETKTIPNLNLSLKLKVQNGSETNSTIVYLPRLSRSMANFSRNSANASLQPIIVSSNRRNLLDLRQYTTRSESRPRDSLNLNNPSRARSNIRRTISRNFTTIIPRKHGLKTSESSQKDFRTFPAPKIRNISKTVHPTTQVSSESTVLVNIKRNLKHGVNTKSNSSTLQFFPSTIPKAWYARNQQRKRNRQGRNFDITDYDSRHGQGTSSEVLISSSVPYETTKLFDVKNSSESPKPFDTVHNISSLNSDSSFANHLSSSLTEEERLLSDLGNIYTVKKAKNLTIYEILKPRLKSSSNESEVFDFSPDLSAFSLKNDAAYHQIKDADDQNSSVSNSPVISIPENAEISNNTFVTNGIEYETPKYANSMLIVPGRSDSTYGIEYVMISRNNSEVKTPPNTTETAADTTDENYLDSNQTVTDFIQQDQGTNIEAYKKDDVQSDYSQKNGGEISEKTVLSDEIYSAQEEGSNRGESYELTNTNSTARVNKSEENLSADGSEYMTLLYESDSERRPKMSQNPSSANVPFKNPRIDSKIFYDYFAKKPLGNMTLQDFPYLEYRPGNMFRYSDIYQRKPILDVVVTRATPTILRMTKMEEDMVTEETVINPTTFNSLRTSVRVMSTYYPNRMQDVTMKFGNRIESTTAPGVHSKEKKPELRGEDDPDDAEYRDSIDPGFTMEKLAYLLIGTCCGLSILCLFVVVIAIKCRRALVEKRLKAQFRKRMYHHERMKDVATPWQQQMFDHFMYLHRRPGDSSCSSNADSCNCRCVTWSLGARNLDATRPLCPPAGRSSLYLYGQKKLPFGAASTLRFESMLGRKRSSPDNNQQKTDSPHTDSSHENDSLDLDSDSREGDAPKQCTCIDYNVWTMPPPNVPRGFYSLCPNAGRYNSGDCSQHPPVELRTIARDIPPPVTGSNYLDRSEGVVYWSSNEERLI